MDWTELKSEIYYTDGSLRDIYIQNTDIEDNEKWCEFANNNYEVNWFNGLKQINEDKIEFETVKGYLNAEHEFISMASIYIGKIQINNHFFEENEIQNDISPREIVTIEDHEKIIEYMSQMSVLLNKPVILTAENENKVVLIKVVKGEIEYFSCMKSKKMDKIERTINEIAQDKIEFDEGCKKVLSDLDFNFEIVFSCLRNYIFNSIPEKTNYNSQAYQDAIQTIPLRATFTPVVILNSFSTKIAFNKLEKIIEAERNKTIIALLWIFKQTDTERRNSVCQNDCGHEWHNIE